MIPTASRLSHGLQRWGWVLISHSLVFELAVSILQPTVVLNHVDSRPHLSPRVLPFASATKKRECMACYSFSDPRGREGWVGLVAQLIEDASPTKCSHNWLPVWCRKEKVCQSVPAFYPLGQHTFVGKPKLKNKITESQYFHDVLFTLPMWYTLVSGDVVMPKNHIQI